MLSLKRFLFASTLLLTSCVTQPPQTPEKDAALPRNEVSRANPNGNISSAEMEEAKNFMMRLDLKPGQKPKLINVETGDGGRVAFEDRNGLAVADDMILGETRDFINPDGTINRTAIRAVAKWKTTTIPYVISPLYPDTSPMPKVIRDSIAYWEANTVVRFIPRTNEKDYILFIDQDAFSGVGQSSSRCASQVGQATKGGQHRVFLSDRRAAIPAVPATATTPAVPAIPAAGPCLFHQGIHEIGHAMGLYHEQTRIDRDEFIHVRYNRLQAGVEHNFYWKDDAIYSLEFDFDSRMLYNPADFKATNDKDTGAPITADQNVMGEKNGTVEGARWVQNVTGFSPSDIQTIAEVYGWPSTLSALHTRYTIGFSQLCAAPTRTLPAGVVLNPVANPTFSDLPPASPFNGTAVHLRNCKVVELRHKWRFATDGTIRGYAGKCLGVANSTDGTAATLTACPRREITAIATRRGVNEVRAKPATATTPAVPAIAAIAAQEGRTRVAAERPKTNQIWTRNQDNSIRGIDGKCLTVKNSAAAEGTALEIRTCSQPLLAGQVWSLTEIPN